MVLGIVFHCLSATGLQNRNILKDLCFTQNRHLTYFQQSGDFTLSPPAPPTLLLLVPGKSVSTGVVDVEVTLLVSEDLQVFDNIRDHFISCGT